MARFDEKDAREAVREAAEATRTRQVIERIAERFDALVKDAIGLGGTPSDERCKELAQRAMTDEMRAMGYSREQIALFKVDVQGTAEKGFRMNVVRVDQQPS